MLKDMFLTYLLFINIIALFLYGMDKRKARKKKWRVKESVLLGIAFLGGCYGSWIGMYLFRHKTQKNKFKFLVPISAFLYTFILGYILF